MAAALFFVLKVLLLVLDFTISILNLSWIKKILTRLNTRSIRSVPVNDKDSNSNNKDSKYKFAHRVDPSFKSKLATSPDPSVRTAYELTAQAFQKHGPLKCMGSRQYLGMKSHKPPIKHFAMDILWKSYAQVGQEVHQFGAALKQAGLVSAPDVATLEAHTTPCSLAIFENTCSDWLIAAQGAFSQGIVVTTIYATLGMDAVIDAVQDGSIRAMVCNQRNVMALSKRWKDSCTSGGMSSLKYLIYTTDAIAPDEVIEMPSQCDLPKGVTIISMKDFVESGKASLETYPPTPPKPTSMAVLMYTSGSTGKPKGVVITHASLLAAIASGQHAFNLVPDDVYLGYLPLAHIMEMMAEFCMIGMGCTICYADPKTLTTKGSYPIGALEQFSPTLMVAVPKIWDVIKKGIEAKVKASPPIAQFLVKTAFQARTFALNHGYDTPLFKALVFKKFSKVVGGNLRLALSGGGPLNSEVQEFIRTCFGVPLVQGYGLTETCAGATIQDPLDLRPGIAGAPIASVEIKLISVPDINDKAGLPYLANDTKDVDGNDIFGRGEVLIKGPSVSLGYYTMPDKTAEVYDDDGFFHTGDIGQFMEDGSLRIVDRVKNLVKLKGGEYIAVEKMEMTYGNSGFVDAIAGGICCYGDGDMDRPIALMQLNEVVAMEWAKTNGVQGDFDSVKKSKELMEAVLADMKNEAAKGGLSHLEKLVAVAFLDEPWTPENGCLTAANKLQRRMVVEKFSKEFEATKAKGIF